VPALPLAGVDGLVAERMREMKLEKIKAFLAEPLVGTAIAVVIVYCAWRFLL
jgi:adenosylmethionine-8-amino-7-oxononanoate aminotransferase